LSTLGQHPENQAEALRAAGPSGCSPTTACPASRPAAPNAEIARVLGVGRASVYRALPIGGNRKSDAA
jgi:hypothetical protein